MGILSTIFGSGEVISKGVEMLDDAFYTDSEKAEDKQKMQELKSKSKIDLLKAYAPFKVAQRYIAIVFLFNFTLSFILILGMTVFKLDTAEALAVVGAFNISWIMITIVMFYFGGGFIDSAKRSNIKGLGTPLLSQEKK